MTEQSFARPAAFVFLDDVRETFLRMFSQNDIQRAIAHSLQKSFEKVLREKMQHYNSSREEIDKVALLEKNVRSYSEEIIQANGFFIFLNERTDRTKIWEDRFDGTKSRELKNRV
jgi:hypothetical protein